MPLFSKAPSLYANWVLPADGEKVLTTKVRSLRSELVTAALLARDSFA